jgi:hypothetical protein
VTVNVKNRAHYLLNSPVDMDSGNCAVPGEFYPVAAAPTVAAFTIDWSHFRLIAGDTDNPVTWVPTHFRATTAEPDDAPSTDSYNAPALILALHISIFWERE